MTGVHQFRPVTPDVALGEDLVIDLTGSEDPTGWALEVKAGYSPSGPPEDFPGLTVTAVGGPTHVIRVTMPREDTLTVATDPETGEVVVYVEVWRTNPGFVWLLRRLAVRFYDPVFEG